GPWAARAFWADRRFGIQLPSGRRVVPVALGELFDREEDGEREEWEPGGLLGAFAEGLVQACAESEAELGEEERLETDEGDGEPEGEVEKADREADREFVEADRESEREHGEAVAGGEAIDRFALVVVLVQEHPRRGGQAPRSRRRWRCGRRGVRARGRA